MKYDYRQKLGYGLFILLFLSTAFHQESMAQRKVKLLNFSHDNDVFVLFTETDRYYSFGANMEFAIMTKPIDTSAESKSRWNHYYNFEASIKGFTPDHLDQNVDPRFERPFLAHSSLSLSSMLNNESYFLHYGFMVGSTGRLINAGKIQNWVHDNISGDRRVRGWDTQVQRKVSFHIHGEWNKKIKQIKRHQFYVGSRQFLGNLFTFIEPGIYYQFRMKGDQYYLPYQYRSGSKSNFQVNAGLAFRYEFFNAELQGEYFDQENKISDEDRIRAMLTARVEFRHDWKYFSLFYANYFNTKKIKNNKVHFYGSLGMALRFY